MNVVKGNKELYHIQNMNITTDGTPFDVFIFTENFPTDTDLKKIFLEEFKGTSNDNAELLDEFLTSSEIYKVWAEEL